MPFPPVYPSSTTYPEWITGGPRPRPPDLRLISEAPDGRGFDLTALAEGLRFSNVDPGGDESAGFTLPRRWLASNPELDKGNLVRIGAGLDVLFQGRIEEIDRSGDDLERVAVTVLGLGVRLKDGRIQRIYVDRSTEGWSAPTLNQRLQVLSANNPLDDAYTASADQESLRFDGTTRREIENGSTAILMYTAPPGTALGAFSYSGSQTHINAPTDVDGPKLYAADDDSLAFGSWDSYSLTLNDVLETKSFPTARAFLMLRMRANSTHTQAAGNPETFTYKLFAVYGDQSLDQQDNGSEPPGFNVEQLVGDAVGQAAGVSVRRLDPVGFLVDHAVYGDPIPPEDVVSDQNKYAGSDWGTWGPASIFDRSGTGYFDFTARDAKTQHWFCLRGDCDELDLSSELSALYNQAQVTYTKVNGTPDVVTRTVAIPELDQRGIVRTAEIDGGTLTIALATQLADTFLALQGSFAPARGQVSLVRPIRHYRRGMLPPYYLRADGSNLRIPDVLPSTTLFALDSDPDRRTTFPIRRVEVDASGAVPKVSVQLDQAFDSLSMLQSRLGLAGGYMARAGTGLRRPRSPWSRGNRYS